MIEKTLIRDKNTNVIINTKLDDYHRLVVDREKQKEICSIKSDISVLKKELEGMKKLLGEALNLKGN